MMSSGKKLSAFSVLKSKMTNQQKIKSVNGNGKTPKKNRRKSPKSLQATPYPKDSEKSIETLTPLGLRQNVVSPRKMLDRRTVPEAKRTDGFERLLSDCSYDSVAEKKAPNETSELAKPECVTSTPQSERSFARKSGATDTSGSSKRKRQENGNVSKKSKKFLAELPIVQSLVSEEDVKGRCGTVEVVKPVPHYMHDSLAEGLKCFEWLIHPVQPERFFDQLWEKKPLLVKRHNTSYFEDLFTTEIFDQILRERTLLFGKNVDLTTYTNSERKTHNPTGRAYPSVVWDHYQNGCSVRLLNPQTFCRAVWKLNASLQEYFGSFVGANIYLTPAGSQGFAPHYDDIEAFVVQLEGKKKWKLYNPRTTNEVLPRFSSGNFTDEMIGECILDVELEAGDVLYFPRGTIHQAFTVPEYHSLHMTVSANQKNAWADLMELMVPRALEIAIENDVDFRESLPRDYMRFTGIVNSESTSVEKKAFLSKTRDLFNKLFDYCPVDSACDQMAKRFVHDSLPPLLSRREKLRSIHGSGQSWSVCEVVDGVELSPDSRIKLLRAGLVRLVMEEEEVRLYHSMENSREYHQEEPQYITVSPELAPGIDHLILAYPKYTALEDLPLATLEDKMEVGNLLYDKGLVMTKEILDPDECP